MGKWVIWGLFAFSLGMILIFTAGMKAEYPVHSVTIPSAGSADNPESISVIAMPIGKNPGFSISTNAHAAKKKPVKMVAAQKTVLYEITAFYLNVRASGNKASKILRVVKKGTMVEATHKTGNGWLQLKGGGYIHGGYAKRLIDGTGKTVKAATLATGKPGKPTSNVQSDSDGRF